MALLTCLRVRADIVLRVNVRGSAFFVLPGSQRTTDANEPLPLCPVRKRVGMIHFVKSSLATAV